MIGLRQDIMQQQCKKKKNQIHPLSMTSIVGNDSNANNNTTTESKDIDVDDIIDTQHSTDESDDIDTQHSKDDYCDNTSGGDDNVRGNKGATTGNSINIQHNIQTASEVDKRINQQTKRTKIKLNNTGSYYVSLLRDLIMISIPFIIMIGILTHPMVVNLGQSDPNAPLTEKQMQEQLLYTLFLKKQQKEICEKYLFLNAMDDRKCYDCPVIDTSAKLIDQQKKNKKGRPRTKRGQAVSKRRLADQRIKQQQAQKNIPGSGIPRKKRGDNIPKKKKGNKMNRPINRKDGPTPAPVLTLFSGTPTQKGSEEVVNKRTIFTDNPLRKFKRKKMKLSKEQKEVWEKVSNKYNRYQ